MTIPGLVLTAMKIIAQKKETVVNALKGEIECTSINLSTDSMTTLWRIMNQREWRQSVT